jgi:hypothetical protein
LIIVIDNRNSVLESCHRFARKLTTKNTNIHKGIGTEARKEFFQKIPKEFSTEALKGRKEILGRGKGRARVKKELELTPESRLP